MKGGLSTYALFRQMVQANDELHTLTEDEVKGLQKVLLEIMDDIDWVCRKYHLTYVISGGGALGMVRHQGFIPWDDDLDICMPRKDYERFRRLMHREFPQKYYIQEVRACRNYDLNFMKVRLNGSAFCEYLDPEPEKAGIFVDIFPVENVYNNWVLRAAQGILANGMQFICSCMRIRKKRERLLKMAKNSKEARCKILLKSGIALPFSIVPFRKWLLWTESVLKMNKRENTRYVSIPTGGKHFHGELYPRKWLFPPKKRAFEDREYWGMAYPERYLERMYGDYMTLPPVEQRERHAVLKFSLLEEEKREEKL